MFGFSINLHPGVAFSILLICHLVVELFINPFFIVPLQPDPRVCHESLMDQIKRGASLRQNGTTNDRSAPKIH